MIDIKIEYLKGKFSSLYIKGHSDDNLVCAGVSSILVGGLNNLETKNYDISIAEGDSYCKSKKEISLHDETVLETIIIQLETIAQSYKKEVKLKKEKLK